MHELTVCTFQARDMALRREFHKCSFHHVYGWELDWCVMQFACMSAEFGY